MHLTMRLNMRYVKVTHKKFTHTSQVWDFEQGIGNHVQEGTWSGHPITRPNGQRKKFVWQVKHLLGEFPAMLRSQNSPKPGNRAGSVVRLGLVGK